MIDSASRRYLVSDLIEFVGMPCEISGSPEGKYFTHASPVGDAVANSVVFVAAERKDKIELFERTRAQIIVADPSLKQLGSQEKCLVIVSEPKLAFARIVGHCFSMSSLSGIHPSSVIHPEARIGDGVTIGAFTYIGRCTIETGSTIHGHCHLYDQTVIGRNVTIQAGTVIGAQGFGYMKNEAGDWENFPHVGGVVIEDDVEIGSNTSIDRGSLGNTLICRGAKIDNLVHVAHNVIIGKNAIVIAHAMIGGSTQVGDRAWISPHTAIRDGLKVGDSALIGMGAVVTKDVPAGETWIGSPARSMQEFQRTQATLRSLDKK